MFSFESPTWTGLLPPTLHSLPTHLLCTKPHKILLGGLHWPSTPLQDWPGACKLPLSGWLLYLYWFKMFPLPIHYAGIPPCWGQLCYSFLWLKPKNYLSNSLGTNPLRVNILNPMGPLLTPLTLAKSGAFPSGPNQLRLLIFQGDRNWSGVRKWCDACFCREWREHTGNNTCISNSASLEGEVCKHHHKEGPDGFGYVHMSTLQGRYKFASAPFRTDLLANIYGYLILKVKVPLSSWEFKIRLQVKN